MHLLSNSLGALVNLNHLECRDCVKPSGHWLLCDNAGNVVGYIRSSVLMHAQISKYNWIRGCAARTVSRLIVGILDMENVN